MIKIRKLTDFLCHLKGGSDKRYLKMKHEIFGEYLLYINPQKNAFFCDQLRSDMTVDRLVYMLVMDCGEWSIYDKKQVAREKREKEIRDQMKKLQREYVEEYGLPVNINIDGNIL